MKKNVSLTPAVFHLSDRVNAVAPVYAANPVVPRGPKLAPLLARVQRKIGEALGCVDTHRSVILTCSGSGAIAAAVASAAPDSGLLVVSNGAYGERQAAFAAQAGVRTVHYALEYGVRPDLAEIERLVTEHGVGAIGMVHGATSTCSLNPLVEVGQLAKRLGVRFIVDAIASVFVDEVDASLVDVIIGSANKGLHSNPDLAFVTVASALLEELAAQPGRIPYLDLGMTWNKQRVGSHPFTISTRALMELEAALDQLAAEGGVPGRHAIYKARTDLLRAGYERLGLERFERAGMPLQSIGTALMLPAGVTYDDLATRLAAWDRGDERYEIYSAQGKLSDTVFRIFNMGDYPLETYERFLGALEATLADLRA
ncbi:MAG: 2-aminoethylphosphonate--pyruvate aminotransferase [Proteobacteria bacterium]|nr:MAG: 2-aminoethylphosphonate--pyruvate aminotransferase [Pseudomonadota bacterium]